MAKVSSWNFHSKKIILDKKCLCYLGPKIWNSLPSELKSSNNIDTFKYKIKEKFFQNIQKEGDDICLLLRTLFGTSPSLLTNPFFGTHSFDYTPRRSHHKNKVALTFLMISLPF